MTTEPTIFEFAGLPRSGKTTAALGLKRYMEAKGCKVHIVAERAGRCPIQDKLHPNFNLWTALSFVREFLVAREQGVQFVIADRGLFDAAIWVEMLCQRGKHAEEYEALKCIGDLPILRRAKQKTFFLFCEVEKVLDREFERTLVKRHGRVMNRQVLSQYLQTYRRLCGDRPPFLELDTTNLPIKDMLSTVYKGFEQS